MNIWPSVDTLTQVQQSQYVDLSVWYSELTSHTHLKPLSLSECGDIVDCGLCPYLMRDTQWRVETVYQYNDPMAAVCSVTTEQPLIYMQFVPTQH